MAQDKKGFVLYADMKGLFDKLPNDKAGELIKHIFSYVNDEDPKPKDLIIEIAFEPIKTQLKRDLKHWEEVRKIRSDVGKMGGRPPKKQTKAKKPIGFSEKQTKANESKKSSNSKSKSNSNSKRDIYKEYDFFIKDFEIIWNDEYIPLKKSKKASVSDRALKMGLEKIKKLSNNNYNAAIEILQKSVDSGWTDFYEIKIDNPTVYKEDKRFTRYPGSIKNKVHSKQPDLLKKITDKSFKKID